MPELTFRVEGVEPVHDAAAPMLSVSLRIADSTGAAVRGIALHAQLRIDPARRRFTPEQQQKLLELFGPAADWGRSLRPMLWTHAHTTVPAFTGSTTADLPVPCTFDLAVAAAKFCHAIDDGNVPLLLLFSGTIFHDTPAGQLQVAPVSWSCDAAFDLPVASWKQAIDRCHPGVTWLALRRHTADRLAEFRRASGHADLDRALEQLLDAAGQVTP